MKKTDLPISEFFNDEMINLSMFFSNGKKEFFRFDKVKALGINKCIFFFPRDFKKLKNLVCRCELIYQFKSASTVSPVYLFDKKVLIALCPLGGPASANLMEELVYVGITYFVGMGSCGAIQEVDLNSLFLPTKAIRDEGTSYHYLPPSRFVECDSSLVTALKEVLTKHNATFNTGTTWTTDAIYRETPMRIASRINDGATCVEMETASLSAVAKARKVKYACLLYFSDFNNGSLWKTRFYNKFELREKLVKYVVEALIKIK